MRTKTQNQVLLGSFAAIILLLAFTFGYIPIGPFKITIIHIPVIVGAILLGPKYGAMLGAIFGLSSFISATFTPVLTSFAFSPFYPGGNGWSLFVCFVPRICVGIIPYFVYQAIKKGGHRTKTRTTIALGAAGVAGALTNTILVLSSIYIFFGEKYANGIGVAYDILIKALMGIVATNGIPEAIAAAMLTMAIGRVSLSILKEN